ncbi:hypothetical protein GCM10010124_33130 [Pilimelia terevasa]|uniref:Uncharacterized protein n=1 Tax=Pilimelia terevasa TaxID=53372 RepID=A0A8J3BVI2_9ACTN|nr:hypothetical protein GCM10010124_33130 [Pilimelia terevasa]
MPPPGGALPPGPPGALPPIGAPSDYPPGAPPYGAGPGFPAAPRKRRTGKIVAIVLGVVLLILCLCGAGAIYLAKRGFDEAKKKEDTAPTALASPTAAPSLDEDSFAKGDCAVNEGTDQNAKLRKVPCAVGTFEVVARVLFTTDRTKCDNAFLGAGKGRYDHTYTHNGINPPADSYVLCMKRR